MRGHNEGTLFQRPNGKKYAAVSLRDGRRVSRRACPHIHKPSDRHRDCPEARETLRALRALRDQGAEALDGSRMTLGQYLRGWLHDVEPQLAPKTWRGHRSIIEAHLGPALGHRRLSDLSVADVRAYLRRDGFDAQTLRHHRATLRRALADAQRDGLVTRNVAALAEPPPLPHRERPILTAAQVRTLIEGTRDDRLHALWVLLATTGLREAEALGLTWEDVNLGSVGQDRPGGVPDARSGVLAGTVYVRHTLHRVPHEGRWELRAPKTPKSRRTVTLPAVTVEALRRHRQAQLEEWLAAGRPGEAGMVFVREDGRPYHGSKLTSLLYPTLDRLGLPRVRVHDLRHSAATILYANGVPLEAIADMLGHSTTRVTSDLYRHRVPELQQAVADVMGRAVG